MRVNIGYCWKLEYFFSFSLTCSWREPIVSSFFYLPVKTQLWEPGKVLFSSSFFSLYSSIFFFRKKMMMINMQWKVNERRNELAMEFIILLGHTRDDASRNKAISSWSIPWNTITIIPVRLIRIVQFCFALNRSLVHTDWSAHVMKQAVAPSQC